MPRFFESAQHNAILRAATLVAAVAALALCAVWARPALASAPDYSDVAASAWYGGVNGYVARVSEKSIMTGYVNTSLFGPEDKLTRAQAVTALFRAVTGDPGGLTFNPEAYSMLVDESGFSDISSGGKYYTAALNWAASEGIARGSGGFFRPDDPITREELVTMAGRSVDNYRPPGRLPDVSIPIVDEESISSWALIHVKWAHRLLLHGNTVEKYTEHGFEVSTAVALRPQDNATRAEAAKILTRFDEIVIQNMTAEPANSNALEKPE